MPDEAEIEFFVQKLLAKQAAKKLAKEERRKNLPPTKPFSVNMFKEFASDNVEVKYSGASYYVDNSWRISCKEMVGVVPCKSKKWNGHIWVGDKVVAPDVAGSKLMGIFWLRVGQGLETRYVVSDGHVWADVYFSMDEAPWVSRWRHDGGKGWRLVDRERKRPLTITAQRVIKVALINFGDRKPLGDLLC